MELSLEPCAALTSALSLTLFTSASLTALVPLSEAAWHGPQQQRSSQRSCSVKCCTPWGCLSGLVKTLQLENMARYASVGVRARVFVLLDKRHAGKLPWH